MWREVEGILRRIRPAIEKKRKAVVIVGILILILLIAVASFVLFKKGKDDDGGNVHLKIIPDNVDLQIKDVHFTEVGDANLTWEIRAETARFVKKDHLAYFDNVQIRLIRNDGKSLTLTGKEGQLRTDTRDAQVTGNVVAVSNDGDVVETDLLHYSNADRRIYTDRKITLTNSRMVMSGEGMSLTLNDQRVSLQSKVKALIKGSVQKK